MSRPVLCFLIAVMSGCQAQPEVLRPGMLLGDVQRLLKENDIEAKPVVMAMVPREEYVEFEHLLISSEASRDRLNLLAWSTTADSKMRVRDLVLYRWSVEDERNPKRPRPGKFVHVKELPISRIRSWIKSGEAVFE